jgi:hypothetical protein
MKTLSYSRWLYCALFPALILCGGSAYALPVPLPDEPLGASVFIPPTILMTADDSGSMDWTYIPDDLPLLLGSCWNDGTPGVCGSSSALCRNNRPPYMASAFNAVAYDPLMDYAPPRTGNPPPAPGSPPSSSLPQQTDWSNVRWREPNGTNPSNVPTQADLNPAAQNRCQYQAADLNGLRDFYLRNAVQNTSITPAVDIWATSANANAVFDPSRRVRPHYYRTSVKWCASVKLGNNNVPVGARMADPGIISATSVQFSNCQDERTSTYRFPYYYSYYGDDPANEAARNNTIVAPFELIVLDATVGAPRVFSSRTGTWNAAISHPYYDEITNTIKYKERTASEEITNFANWWAYYSTRSVATRTAATIAFDDAIPYSMNPPPRLAFNRLWSPNFAVNDFTDTYRVEFLRLIRTQPATGGTPIREVLRYNGERFLRNQNQEIKYRCQRSYNILFTDGMWNMGNTNPAPSATINTVTSTDIDGGKIGKLPSAPPTGFTCNVPAGSFKQSDMKGVTVYHLAGDLGADNNWPDPIRDHNNANGMLSDIALYFWKTALGGNIDSGLKDPDTDAVIPMCNTRDVARTGKDPATWPHLNFYAMGYGIQGTLPTKDQDDTINRVIAGNLRWPAPAVNTDDQRKADDVWHAAVNGFGRYIATRSADEFRRGLSDILNDILGIGGARSGVAFTNPDLRTIGGYTYTPSYSASWSGDIERKPISNNGKEGPVDQSASARLRALLTPTPTNPDPWKTVRQVFTYLPLSGLGGSIKGKGFPVDATPGSSFALSSLMGHLGATPDDQEKVVAYLRGDQSNEGENLGQFRSRSELLSDIVNAKPLVVGAPEKPSNYNEQLNQGYEAFYDDYINRATMVYAAANDGMLHAFDEELKEKWAYMPSELFRPQNEAGIINLTFRRSDTVNRFNHYYYVDATPSKFDVFFKDIGKWRTVLVGGLGKGGTSYYALDITEAGASDAGKSEPTIAGEKVLWEFPLPSDTEAYKNMGYTYGRPILTKVRYNTKNQPGLSGYWGTSSLKNDKNEGGDWKWVAIFPSGYNNGARPVGVTDVSDRRYQPKTNGDGRGRLYIIDLETGWPLPGLEDGIKTPDGYGSPETPLGLMAIGGYVHNYSHQVTTAVYAGDQQGNLWRFNLESEKIEDWLRPHAVKKLATLVDEEGKPQWVTTEPWPQRIDGKRWVFVGTGGIRSEEDIILNHPNTNTRTKHTFYAIRDGGDENFGGVDTVAIEGEGNEADGITPKTKQSVIPRSHMVSMDDIITNPTTFDKTKYMEYGFYHDMLQHYHVNLNPVSAFGRVAYAANRYVGGLHDGSGYMVDLCDRALFIGKLFGFDIRSATPVFGGGGVEYVKGIGDFALTIQTVDGKEVMTISVTGLDGRGLDQIRPTFVEVDVDTTPARVPIRTNIRYINTSN